MIARLILIRSVWHSEGGFDTEYEPATSFCPAARKRHLIMKDRMCRDGCNDIERVNAAKAMWVLIPNECMLRS